MADNFLIKRKVGRPFKEGDDKYNLTREVILNSAKELFIKMPYSKVSIIKIAKLAGINPSLVRYYFINKDNLYQEVLVGISTQLKSYLMESDWEKAKTPVEPILLAYIKVFKKQPSVTRLVFREMLSNDSTEKKKLLNYLLIPNAMYILNLIHKYFEEDKQFINLQFLISFMSGMIFNFALKDALEETKATDILPTNYGEKLKDSIVFIESAYLELFRKKP